MSALRKLLAVILDWPKTTVLLALALVADGVDVAQRLAVGAVPDTKVTRGILMSGNTSTASCCDT